MPVKSSSIRFQSLEPETPFHITSELREKGEGAFLYQKIRSVVTPDGTIRECAVLVQAEMTESGGICFPLRFIGGGVLISLINPYEEVTLFPPAIQA